MKRTLQELRLVVASPEDVRAERDAVDDVVSELNRGAADERGLVLKVTRWERDSFPGFHGGGPQALIDSILRIPHCDIFVGILWKRFGTPVADALSGTQHEFDLAYEAWKKTGHPQILFYFNRKPYSPKAEEELIQWQAVLRFQKGFPKEGLWWHYNGKANFKELLRSHLESFLRGHSPLGGEQPPAPRPPRPRQYLTYLQELNSHIEIRGLQVGSGKAQSLPIQDLYISLTTTPAEEPDRKRVAAGSPVAFEGRGQRVHLEQALANRRLVIVGDPGSGKTTFLRRLAFLMCGALLRAPAADADRDLPPADKPFPMLIPVARLYKHIERNAGLIAVDAPAWIPHCLAAWCAESSLELDEKFFQAQMEGDASIVLLDSLDEAPSDKDRRHLAALIKNAANRYRNCRFVVTSRPTAYRGEVVLPGFAQAQIDELEDEAIDTFLKRWCGALFPESARQAETHYAELRGALRVSEIRRMARNPVMLTALGVIHWHEKRLPERRADLYESVLNWLARARESRPGRPSPERSIALLQNLALTIQDHPKGRQVQVPRYWAARSILLGWRDAAEENRAELAENFLREEEVDSGIVVSRGDDIRFWHLTFQEYLAARALAARDDRRRQLYSDAKLHQPEWREVVVLLAGVLYHQGIERVDDMMSAVLDRLGNRASLADQARAVGLLGACVRDLTPVHYQPADPRYKQTLDAVLGIFDAKKARTVEFQERLEAAEALGQAGDPRLREDQWITIEAGKFSMGAQRRVRGKPNYDSEAGVVEAPVHEVYLDAFQMGRYPVTVEEYRKFVEDDGYSNQEWWKGGSLVGTNEPGAWGEQVLHPNRPVVDVSWFEAAAYCAWLTTRSGHEVRLPTEAEWKRAARGTTGRKYPWGNEEPDTERANYGEGNVGHATPVGLYPHGATPEGIDDLAGNVWEWVADWYGEDYYGESPGRNPKGTQSGELRVLRGGAWGYGPGVLRAAFRGGDGDDGFGFRCVREVVP
jgi:formylglycine-generating enzyme required for sulfatase activity